MQMGYDMLVAKGEKMDGVVRLVDLVDSDIIRQQCGLLHIITVGQT